MKLTQLIEEKERPYVVFHTKKGKYETHAVSSYDAAKNAAKHWGLKSTAGITPKLADVEHVAEEVISEGPCDIATKDDISKMNADEYAKYAQWKKDCEAEERTTPLSTKRLESFDDYQGDMSQEEYDQEVDNSQMEYAVWVGGTEVNDKWLTYDEAITLYDKYKAQGYDDIKLDARIKESVNEAEKRWKQTSMSPAEAEKEYGKENVKVKKGALRNGDDMVEVFVESYSPGDEYADSEGMVSNCCGAPMMDYNDGHGRCSDCKEMAAGETDEEFYESYSNDGKTVTISDYQPEGEANSHKKFNLRKQIHRGEDGKLIKSPYGGYKVSFHGNAEDVKAYAEKSLGEASKKQKPFYDKPLKEEDKEAVAARDEFLKVMDMKPKSSNKAIDTIKKIVADKQNQQVKFDDGKMKVDLYTASAISQVYDAVKPETQEKIDNMLRTKEGMLKMSNFAFSKISEGLKEGKRIDEILPIIGAIAGAIGRKVAGGVVKNVAKKAAGSAAIGSANAAGSTVGNAAQSSGMNASAKAKGKKLNAVKEAGGYYTQPVYDMIKQHGYKKVMHELLTSLDADVIQDFISRADLNEAVELDTSGDYANVYYEYREDYYMIEVFKDGKLVAEDDDYFGAMAQGNPLKDKFLELVKKAGLEPEGLRLVSTGGDEPDETGVYKNGRFNWHKNEALPAVGTAIAGGLKKAAGAVGKLANKADTAAFGLKSKDGVKYNANSPQGKMIRNMAKDGKTQGAKSDAKKGLVRDTVAGLKKKVGGIGGMMKTAAGSSGFLPASKQYADDMVEKAKRDAEEIEEISIRPAPKFKVSGPHGQKPGSHHPPAKQAPRFKASVKF